MSSTQQAEVSAVRCVTSIRGSSKERSKRMSGRIRFTSMRAREGGKMATRSTQQTLKQVSSIRSRVKVAFQSSSGSKTGVAPSLHLLRNSFVLVSRLNRVKVDIHEFPAVSLSLSQHSSSHLSGSRQLVHLES